MVIPLVVPMRVLKKRWGEVSIKKQGAQKNQFDKTRSFSIVQTNPEYTIDALEDVLEMAVNLTEHYEYRQLIAIMRNMMNGHTERVRTSSKRRTRKQ